MMDGIGNEQAKSTGKQAATKDDQLLVLAAAPTTETSTRKGTAITPSAIVPDSAAAGAPPAAKVYEQLNAGEECRRILAKEIQRLNDRLMELEKATPAAGRTTQADTTNAIPAPKVGPAVKVGLATTRPNSNPPEPTQTGAAPEAGSAGKISSPFSKWAIFADFRHLKNDLMAFKATKDTDPAQASDRKIPGIAKVMNVLGDVFTIAAGGAGGVALGYLGYEMMTNAASPSYIAGLVGAAAGFFGYGLSSNIVGGIGHALITKLGNPENWGSLGGGMAGCALAAGAVGITTAASAPIWGSILAGSAALGIGYIGASSLINWGLKDFIRNNGGDAYQYSSEAREQAEKKKVARPPSVRSSSPSKPKRPDPYQYTTPQEFGVMGASGSDLVGSGRAGGGVPS